MSLSKCIKNFNYQSPVTSLFPQAKNINSIEKDSVRYYFKRHLCRISGRKKASYSIEASVALPVFMGFAVCILFFIRVLMIGWAIDESMTFAVDTVAVSSDSPSVYAAEALFYEQLLTKGVGVDAIQGGVTGINLMESSVDEKDVTLSATYRVRLPVRLFSREGLFVCQKKSARIWNGYDPKEQGDDGLLVYVTPYGSAYHRSASCPYINPSIVGVGMDGIGDKRNSGGHRYGRCPMCGGEAGDTVYITTWGECYHGSISCSGLKRTLYRIELSEAKEKYHPCPKCGSGD